ncbi:hypothetical protein EDD15DRAFT_2196529 [Pisolithus albus]|nr:hypothetical protein EDD15DRAFT_2196529 [Pisolithus albus]
MPPIRSQPARAQSIPPLPALRPEALQPLPLLSSQMELEYQQVLRMVVVSQQEMRRDASEITTFQSDTRPKSTSTFVTAADEGNSSLSSLESLEPEAKIPKPPGEVGRPGRGGYNLEEHLKWPDHEMRGLKRVIHAAVKKYLDTTKSRTFQDLEAIKKAKRRFSQLEDYENCWPVLDLIHLRLKYLSSRHRQRHRRETPECATK